MRHSYENDADKRSDLLSYLKHNNFGRNIRNEPETLTDDDNPYPRKAFGLRHFKNRKPLLSFGTKRFDDTDWIGSMRAYGKRADKKKGKSQEDYNRWSYYSQYYPNSYQKRPTPLNREEEAKYRQYFQNSLLSNM
jgi:hypothetical protein